MSNERGASGSNPDGSIPVSHITYHSPGMFQYKNAVHASLGIVYEELHDIHESCAKTKKDSIYLI